MWIQICVTLPLPCPHRALLEPPEGDILLLPALLDSMRCCLVIAEPAGRSSGTVGPAGSSSSGTAGASGRSSVITGPSGSRSSSSEAASPAAGDARTGSPGAAVAAALAEEATPGGHSSGGPGATGEVARTGGASPRTSGWRITYANQAARQLLFLPHPITATAGGAGGGAPDGPPSGGAGYLGSALLPGSSLEGNCLSHILVASELTDAAMKVRHRGNVMPLIT